MKQILPIFFAADNNTLPFTAVALLSIQKHASPRFLYRAHILHAELGNDRMTRMKTMESANFRIEFHDLRQCFPDTSRQMCCTDITYYRNCIAEMFPQYEKALYLDSHVIALADVSKLYKCNLGNSLVGAVPDTSVLTEPELSRHVQEVLGLAAEKYFHAGVLLMNLKRMRDEDFSDKLTSIMKDTECFPEQIQDCWNILCRNRVTFFPSEWHKTPLPISDCATPKLIRFTPACKPWKHAGIPYHEYFWQYAIRSTFLSDIWRIADRFETEETPCETNHAQKLSVRSKLSVSTATA